MDNRESFLKWALVASAAILFFTLGHRALWDPDEGRYAEMAREILALHDWVTPHLNYIPYLEKPMLFMWLNAMSFAVFGATEWAARLVPFLCALAGAAVTGLMAFRLWGRRAGLLTSLCLMTSLEYVVLSSVVDINMTLTLFITAAMVFFWLGHMEKRPWHLLLAWASLGLACLTKGPVGVVLPVGAVGLYILLTRQFSLIRESKPIRGTGLFLAIVLPWFVLVSLRNPEFFSYFFIDQNIARYSVSSEHNKPFFYFVLVVLGGALPWTFMLPEVVRKLTGRRMPREILYILLWFFVILLFFMPSQSKLATYVLPCFPPLALLLGYACKDAPERGGVALFCAGALWLCLGVGLALFPTLASHGIINAPSPRTAPLMGIAHAAGAILIPGTLAAMWIGRRYDRAAGYALLGISVMILFTVFTPGWDDQRSTRSLVQDLPPEANLCAYKRYYQSSGFYAKRQVLLVDAAGELKFGIRNHPDKARVLTTDDLALLMSSDPETFCLTSSRNLASLREKIPGIAVARQSSGFSLLHVPGRPH